jgi:hypothetical protein
MKLSNIVALDANCLGRRSNLVLPSLVTQGLPTVTNECVSGCEYYHEDGLRKVRKDGICQNLEENLT